MAICADATRDHGPGRARSGPPEPADRPVRVRLTHWLLACGQFGTALGVVQAAVGAGRDIHVHVDETRPYLQGARLTAWELEQAGVPYTVIPDSAAGSLLASGTIDAVLVGADRIAANGDTANKIGTYSLAALAARHRVPFYVCAPVSQSASDVRCRRSDRGRRRRAARVPGVRVPPVPPPGTRRSLITYDLISAIVTEGALWPVRPGLQRLAAARRASA